MSATTGTERAVHARPMRAADLDAVLAIERVSYPSPWQRRHFLHELHANPFAVCHVLERAGRVAGYACCWHVDDELRINNIAIAERERGLGLGRALLRLAIAAARRGGCRRATLEVRPSNRRAQALYRSEGFVEVGRRRNYYALEGEDAIVMQLDIVRARGV